MRFPDLNATPYHRISPLTSALGQFLGCSHKLPQGIASFPRTSAMLRLFGKEKKSKTSLLLVQEDKMIKMKPKSELLMDEEEGARDTKRKMVRMESRRMRKIGKITWLPAIFLLLLLLPSSSASAEEQQLEGSKVKTMKTDHN